MVTVPGIHAKETGWGSVAITTARHRNGKNHLPVFISTKPLFREINKNIFFMSLSRLVVGWERIIGGNFFEVFRHLKSHARVDMTAVDAIKARYRFPIMTEQGTQAIVGLDE